MAQHNGTDVMGRGTDLVAVKEHNGQVVVQLPPGCNWAALDPETARQFAEALARSAYKAHYGVEAMPARSAFTDQKRERLVRRIEIMLTGFIPKVPAMTPEQMAVAITDTLLAEVL